MKRFLTLIPFVLLIIVTFISVFTRKKVSYSYDLTLKRTETDTTVRQEYVDSSGQITFAANKGYAVLVETRTNANEGILRYYDETGEPVKQSGGYDTIHRTYTSFGKAERDTYYLGDQQIEHKDGYYQFHRIYGTNRRICEMHYLDREGKLICNSYYYAIIRRTYSDTGYTDMYFDENDQPVRAYYGQDGIRKEGSRTTYLDREGRVITTTKGYAITRTDGGKMFYYDEQGKPVSIGQGQYGYIKNEYGIKVFLDAEGEPILRLDTFLHTHPEVVFLMGIVITVIAAFLKGKLRILCLILYILFIGIMTIAFRESASSHGQFIPFYSFLDFFGNATVRQGILNNFWLFVPLGALVYSRERKRTWLIPILLSLLIETVQFATGTGLCEIDDVISNSVGGLIGYGVAGILCRSICHPELHMSS